MTTQKRKDLASESSKAVTYELPFINQGDNILISAFLLHKKLKVKTRFNDWVNRRFEEYGFVENEDFYSNLSNQNRNGRGGDRKSTDYLLTLDTAKEIAMVERNEAGRQIRRYFIAKEKELRCYTSMQAELSGTFAGLQYVIYRGQKGYCYTEVLRRIGYSTRAQRASRKRKQLPQHFFSMFGRNFCSVDFATYMAEAKQLQDSRQALQQQLAAQPTIFSPSKSLSHE